MTAAVCLHFSSVLIGQGIGLYDLDSNEWNFLLSNSTETVVWEEIWKEYIKTNYLAFNAISKCRHFTIKMINYSDSNTGNDVMKEVTEKV